MKIFLEREGGRRGEGGGCLVGEVGEAEGEVDREVVVGWRWGCVVGWGTREARRGGWDGGLAEVKGVVILCYLLCVFDMRSCTHVPQFASRFCRAVLASSFSAGPLRLCKCRVQHV